jgi:hypothetical protein
MICPKCGFEQPESPECVRCGIVISRYKGPVLGAPPGPPSPPSAEEFGNETVMTSVPPPPPPVETGGTLYGAPAPAMAAASGGTIYSGPSFGVPAPTFGVPAQPAFRGTFEVGKVLGETFSTYFANFIPFVLLTALALSPVYMLQAYIAAAGKESLMAAFSGLVLVFASVLCPQIATAAITYGVFQQMRGKDTSISDCLSRGLSSLFPVLMLALVQGIIIGIGILLCVVPGIIAMVRWAVSVPAAVEERQGVSGAMDRSTYLTDGFRWDIFGVLFVLGVLSVGSTLVVMMVAGNGETLLLVASGLKDLLTVGLSATASAVMYYRLRSVKESIDVDQIASVFA